MANVFSDIYWQQVATKLERERDEVLAALKEWRAEAGKLRKVIEEAPHDWDCESLRLHDTSEDGLCDCWKRDVLKSDG